MCDIAQIVVFTGLQSAGQVIDCFAQHWFLAVSGSAVEDTQSPPKEFPFKLHTWCSQMPTQPVWRLLRNGSKQQQLS